MTDQSVAVRHNIGDDVLSLVGSGDASKLNAEQKVSYYKARCDAAGLDYRAQPFQFIAMNGKLVLYALKAATDQLASKHGIRCEITHQSTENGMRTVTVRAVAKDGRQTDEIGVVPVEGLKGNDLANAFMKTVTKAKRRAILSVCGLGMMDETELDTVTPDTPKPVSHFAREIPKDIQGPETEEPPTDAIEPEVEPAPTVTVGPFKGEIIDESPIDESPIDAVDAALFPPKAPSGEVISPKQANRLYAIWKTAKKDDGTVKAWLLQAYGYASSKEILKKDYEEICKQVVAL